MYLDKKNTYSAMDFMNLHYHNVTLLCIISNNKPYTNRGQVTICLVFFLMMIITCAHWWDM